MMKRRTAITSFGALIAMAVFSQVSAAAVPCESLVSLSLPNTTIASARVVAAGESASLMGAGGGNQDAAFRNLPAFCRVTATLRPSSDSDIKMEVWMPVMGWNCNFQANGSGGMGGAIPLTNLAQIIRRLERRHHPSGDRYRLLQEGSGRDRRRERAGIRAPVHGAWDDALSSH